MAVLISKSNRNFQRRIIGLFFYRRSTSLPLPPPPNLTEEGNIVQDELPAENDTSVVEKAPKYFFAPLKSKRKSSVCAEMRPDVFVSNGVPLDGSRVATIRKPHNPLKYPSNLNIASIDPEVNRIFCFKFKIYLQFFKKLKKEKFSFQSQRHLHQTQKYRWFVQIFSA